MKHLKFQDNIDEDSSYSTPKRTESNGEVQEFIDKIASDETKKWYKNLPEEPTDIKPLSEEEVMTLKKEANSVLHGESLAYETKMNRGGSSDQKWARSLLSKGAMADRVAAATILIQDSPVHHLSTLRNLVSMVKPAKKKDSLTVMETLSELFLFDLLLPEAKLRPFENRPLSQLEKMCSGNRDHRRKILINWIFEDQLKEVYGEYIKCLNTFAHDTIEAHKEKAISTMSKLLMHNPEQEKVLLSNIINKLGDPSQKVASKVIYHLCQVLFNHPNMKKVVLDEIEKMLFRPNISPKAQYYGVCFLNQFYLSKDDNKVAENLVRVYFSFFKASIKKGDIDSRLMSAILTGVKRCQPFLGQQKIEEIQTQADALHRLVHLARYNIALHALALLFQISPLAKQLSDRYYCALYKKLGDPETLTTTLPALMMNLVYRSIKADKCKSRVLAFLKRLLQLAALSDAPRACAFLLLIARLARNQKIPMKWLQEPDIKDESLINEAVPENTEDEVLEKSDVNASDNNKNKKSKKKKAKKPIEVDIPVQKSMWIGDKTDLLVDDGEEVYHDVPLEEDEEDHKKKLKKIVTNKKTKLQGWMHLPDVKEELVIKSEEGENDDSAPKVPDTEEEKKLKMLIKKTQNAEKVITEYDPFHRNPAYCGAEHSVFCELSELSNHFHPTVRLFAEKLLNGSFVQYSGDPLIDFSIARFLDRFAFKNPKKDPASIGETAENGQEVKTVKGSHPKFAQRKNYLAGGLRSLPVNSSAYLNESYARIPVDERFLYDYLQTRKSANEDDEDAESDADSINSEDFNSYLDKLSGSKNVDDSENSENEDELDYMKDILSNKGKNKGREKDTEEGESDDDNEDAEASDDNIDGDEDSLIDGEDDNENLDDIDDEDEDSELDFSEEDVKSKKSKPKKNESDDESELNFSDDEDDTFDVPKMSKSKGKGNKGLQSMFASAEEFAELLEETGTVKGQGTSQALSNSENAHGKQLDWETSRDRWVKGYNKKSKPSNGTNFNKKSFKGKPMKGTKNFNKGHKRKGSEKSTFNGKRKRL